MKRLSILLIIPLVVINIQIALGYEITPQSGILVVKGSDLPVLIGVPENNLRFASWNGTTWIELPFWIEQETIIEMAKFEVNGTSTESVISEIHDMISAKDLISVKIPAELGVKASDGNWWSKALHLGLQNRFSLQLSSSDTNYDNFIYVYYRTEGRILPPIYPLNQYSNLISKNGTETMSTSSLTTVSFKLHDFTDPQTIKLYQAENDPQVYSLDAIMLQKFEGTGWTPQPTSPFYLPAQGQAVTGVILRIEGKAYDDDYSRYLQVYINDQKLWSGNGKIVSGSFSYSVDITNKIQWWDESTYVMNTGKVTLTTYVGYWVVRTYIYVVYNANNHFRQFYSQYAPWYKFEETGWDVINFPAQLPESIANEANGAKITIHAKPYDDPYCRYLDLYIDGQKVKRWVICGETTVSYDVTSYLLGKRGTTVGIVLTTYVGYWIVDGYIRVKYRPGVAPDSSNYWNAEIHPLTQRAGNIYNDYWYPNDWIGIFSFDTRTKEGQTKPTFYTGVTVKIPSSASFYYLIHYVEMVIKAKHEYHGYIDGSYFLNLETFTGSEDGAKKAKDIGSDLLSILAAGLSIVKPELAAVASVASVLIKYISTEEFSYDRLDDGIYLSWTNWYNIDEKSILYAYDIDWPYLGQYTVEVHIKIEIWFYFWNTWIYSGSVNFVNKFTYYNA